MHLRSPEGQILGYIVSAKGIDPNPDKVQAILNMKVPENIKDVENLIGRLVVLNRFISKSAERSLPIFQALKGTKKRLHMGTFATTCIRRNKKLLVKAKYSNHTNLRG